MSGRDRGSGTVVALAGGVGAARFLRGLVRRVPPADVTAMEVDFERAAAVFDQAAAFVQKRFLE